MASPVADPVVLGSLAAAAAAPPVPLQAGPFGSGVVALVTTFLVTALFYAVTLHLAALWVLGDVPHQKAAAVAPLLAVVSLLLQQWGAVVVVPVTFVADLLGIGFVYDVEARPAVVLAVFHFAVAVIVGVTLVSLLGAQ